MSLKREISVSLRNLQESTKRLHIDVSAANHSPNIFTQDQSIGHLDTLAVNMAHPNNMYNNSNNNNQLTTVMSTAESDFHAKYDLIREIGRKS